MMGQNRLGNTLLSDQLLDSSQWEECLAAFEEDPNKRMPEIIVEKGFADEQSLLEFFARHYRHTIVDLSQFELDRKTSDLLPGSICAKYNVVPVGQKGQTLVVAMFDPTNVAALDQIKFQSRMRVEPVLALGSSIRALVERYYGMDIAKLSSSLEKSQEEAFAEGTQAGDVAFEVENTADAFDEDDAPIVQFVGVLLTDAIRKKASDVHIEPYEKDLRVRVRIDGELVDSVRPPPTVKNAIIARIKVMAQLRLDEKRLPQDGRVRFRLPEGKIVDFRVNTLPTVYGEKVVIRILDKQSALIDFDQLGFEKDDQEKFSRAIKSPWGMCLVTGATGSGKTTTLYAGLNMLNTVGVNISTIEDPVEYNFMGMNQCQVREGIGFSFAEALRAMLRQDPDIILVGEVRDSETAEVAMKAALTGHMVMSTLHTNDAPGTIVRLKDLNVEPFLINSAVKAVLAQRLVRKICSHCKVHDTIATEKDLIDFGFPRSAIGKFKPMRGEGCQKCRNTGSLGRMAVYEVMEMTDAIREVVGQGGDTDKIRKVAIKEGMRTLQMNCMRKIVRGQVALEELKSIMNK